MNYHVTIHKRALKQMALLSAKDRKRVDEAIASLGSNPFQGKALEGEFKGAWSIRVWPYRILYAIDKKIVTVTVLRVGHRQGIYNG